MQGFWGEADATLGQELVRFDSPDRVLNQMAELFALLVANDRPENTLVFLAIAIGGL